MSEENNLDREYESPNFKGCIIYQDDRRIRLCRCDDCTPTKRTTCQVPKMFLERYPDWECWGRPQ